MKNQPLFYLFFDGFIRPPAKKGEGEGKEELNDLSSNQGVLKSSN